jgi:hypothetical protein
MWSLRCLLIGHDDMLLRRPHRLSLQCSHCDRETKGWNLSRSDQGAIDTWVQVGACIPAIAAVSLVGQWITSSTGADGCWRLCRERHPSRADGHCCSSRGTIRPLLSRSDIREVLPRRVFGANNG